MAYDPNTPDSWQQHCTSELLACLSAMDGAAQWANKRAQLSAQQRIIIADADLSNKDILGYDFRWIYFVRTKFSTSKLNNTNFEQSIISDCDFNYCNLSGAKFRYASVRANCFMMHVTWDNSTDFLFQKGPLPATIDVTIIDFIDSAWRRDEFNRNNRGLAALISRSIGYGQSISRLFACAGISITAFAVMFFMIGSGDIRTCSDTFTDCIIYSIKYFIALTDSYEDSSKILSFLGTVESCLGLAFLALLISAITKKFVISR